MFILGRMGNARQALHLIITDLGDVAQAVDFVALQGDPDLWQLLLSLALADPALTGAAPLSSLGMQHLLACHEKGV